MFRSRAFRLTSLTLANILLPISVLIFATGFFPYKPFLAGLATFEDVVDAGEVPKQPAPVFDRVVFMVVDALRSDFVFGAGSGFEFVQSLIRDGAAIPFTAHATPPTVTMPRVKALTTGSVPSFLDLILNFAESDTSSSLATQDTWLAQLRAHRRGKLVFYGDDTWLKLFPDTAEKVGEGGAKQDEDLGGDDRFWLRHDGTSSFFVSDFTEVDNNVTRHIPSELQRDDWNAMVMHYLGLDHIGHKTGPQGPSMLPKQREMDGIVKTMYEAMERENHLAKTVLVLLGDHGMNAGGNHGGSGPGETEPAMVFASPVLKSMEKRKVYQCPTLPKEGTEFHFYTKIGQSDFVPTLAAMMGMPVSKNSLGLLIREVAGLWDGKDRLQLLRQNARQLLHVVRAKYGAEWFDVRVEYFLEDIRLGEAGLPLQDGSGGDEVDESYIVPDNDADKLASSWAYLLIYGVWSEDLTDLGLEAAEDEYYRFLELAQEIMSDTASSYDIPRMVLGMGTIGVALLLAVVSFPSLWPPSFGGVFFAVTVVLYGVMMFASSYVEEEQHFWYWMTPTWVVLLTWSKLREGSSARQSNWAVGLATLCLLATHRLTTRWNQTGQKHAGEPDIVHTLFPEHHQLMWLLILATYVLNGYLIRQRSFKGLFQRELAVLVTASLVLTGVVFKLNFTQADAPELVQHLAVKVRESTEGVGLVWQARAMFVGLGTAAAAIMSLDFLRRKKGSKAISWAERLHHLLTLFLMTQTRAPNIPLFAFLEIQRAALSNLLASPATTPQRQATTPSSRALQTAISTLLLSHTFYFCMGGSNSISSIDLSNAYNGVADYNIAAVGVLLFVGNWAGAVWWCSAGMLLMQDQRQLFVRKNGEGEKDWIRQEREKLRQDSSTINAASKDNGEAFSSYLSTMTTFIAASLMAVMAACTILRTHLFIWTVFSPKFLYAMAWAVAWGLLVNIGFGSLLWALR